MTIGKFDYKKWVVENKFGKTSFYNDKIYYIFLKYFVY